MESNQNETTPKSIGVVIVTYNRVEKLEEALRRFEEQTYPPTYILVVNNASTDGTNDMLKNWERIQTNYKKMIINMKSNVGGSGGFHRGLEEALKLDAEWVWVSDDDAFPDKDALKTANYFLTHENSNISAICGAVINNGEIDLGHRKKVIYSGNCINFKSCSKSLYKSDKFEVDLFSYVGAIIKVQKMKEVGTTNKDFFIWFDDSEHSLRLGRSGKIFCIPQIRVHHDVGFINGNVSWKSYYGIRNEIYSVKKHFRKTVYWCYLLGAILHSIKKYVVFSTHLKGKLELIGIVDGMKGKLGIHRTYKPGWKPKEN